MNKIFTLISLLLLNLSLFAQPSLKWGKPNKQELELKYCPFDSSAPAVILAEKGSVTFINGYAHYTIYRKIKVLKQEGLEFANEEIPYYSKNNMNDIQDIKAHTIHNNTTSITEVELKNSEIFTKDLESYIKAKAFTFPSANVGSILEYKYTIVTKDLLFLEPWAFQHAIPTLYSEISAEIPEYLNYKVFLLGDQLKKEYPSGSNLSKKWVLNNIPGYYNEQYVFCPEDYINQLHFQLESYHTESDSYDNRTKTQFVSNNWERLAEEVKADHEQYLSRYIIAKNLLEKIISAGDSKEEKIKKIYNYVHGYKVDYFSAYIIQDFSELLKTNIGSSGEINLLLCLLLNQADIPAYPVLVSTRENGKITKNYPLLSQFNHVLIAIENADKYKLLDATNDNNNCYSVPYTQINYFGFLIKNKENSWINLEYPEISKVVSWVKCKVTESDINWNYINNYSGYPGHEKRNEYKSNKVKEPHLSLNNTLIISKTESKNQNLEDDYKEFIEEYNYQGTRKNNNKIYISLNTFNDENPFKQKTRLFPVELNYPYIKQQNFTIQFSPSDTIQSVPKNLVLALKHENIEFAKFSYKTTKKLNTLTVTIHFEIIKTIVPVDYYGFLKDFMSMVISKMNEPIIIEKK